MNEKVKHVMENVTPKNVTPFDLIRLPLRLFCRWLVKNGYEKKYMPNPLPERLFNNYRYLTSLSQQMFQGITEEQWSKFEKEVERTYVPGMNKDAKKALAMIDDRSKIEYLITMCGM